MTEKIKCTPQQLTQLLKSIHEVIEGRLNFTEAIDQLIFIEVNVGTTVLTDQD